MTSAVDLRPELMYLRATQGIASRVTGRVAESKRSERDELGPHDFWRHCKPTIRVATTAGRRSDIVFCPSSLSLLTEEGICTQELHRYGNRN